MNSAYRGFICDRMLGSLCKYLRFMGYDTLDANCRLESRKEDTILLQIAQHEGRLLLTRDRELSTRDKKQTIYIVSEDMDEQIRELCRAELIVPEIRLTRCSLCNTQLRMAKHEETALCSHKPDSSQFYWCSHCQKLYWEGSHIDNLREHLQKILLFIQ